MLIRFHRIPERDGRTDGQTDIIAIGLSISRVSMLTRDENEQHSTTNNALKYNTEST